MLFSKFFFTCLSLVLKAPIGTMPVLLENNPLPTQSQICQFFFPITVFLIRVMGTKAFIFYYRLFSSERLSSRRRVNISPAMLINLCVGSDGNNTAMRPIFTKRSKSEILI